MIVPGSSNAGTIITTNLPAGDVIININALQDGAAEYGGTPSYNDWYQPFNTSNTLLEYTFQPGTYQFRILDHTDAQVLCPLLTSSQLNQIGAGAWSWNTPWGTIGSPSIAPPPAILTSINYYLEQWGRGMQMVPAAAAYEPGGHGPGYYDQVVTGSGRYTGTSSTTYTFAAAETLIFAVPYISPR